MSSKHKWTLLFFISKFQIICKFSQLVTSVSDFGLAFRVQAIHAVYVVRGKIWHASTSAKTELNNMAGSQQSDQINEKQKPFVYEEADDINTVSALINE